ncbi:glycosyltransferase family 2 protein [Marinilactibacillus psychrotolerans]|uniref:glycosyltransferase family 2 protein n=1 Tax=Marinilactibacillus psychrotolerans TaxID=191770 RepID=UPI00388B8C6E
MHKILSIIVPVYNVEEYIEECLESVLLQKTQNVELIVINDGSTDKSEEKVEKLQKIYEFQFITQQNSGLSATRNKGLSMASGQYVIFLDSDDYWHKDTVEKILKTIKTFNPDLIRFNAKAFFEEKVTLDYPQLDYDLSSQLLSEHLYEDEELKFNFDSFKSSACLYAFKKKIIDKENLKFDETIIHEDQLFTSQLFLLINSMVYLNQNLYFRRYRSNSITTNRSLDQLKYSYLSYYKIIKLYEIMLQNHSYNKLKTDFLKRRARILYNTANEYPLKFQFRAKFIKKYEIFNLQYIIMTEIKIMIKKFIPSGTLKKLKKLKN